MLIICPGCHALHDVSDLDIGMEAACSCGTTFVIEDKDWRWCIFAFDCPACGGTVLETLYRCGKPIVCPHCRQNITAPATHDRESLDFLEKAQAWWHEDDKGFRFVEADEYLAARLLRVTSMTHKELSKAWDDQTRYSYFFLARVTDPIVLARIRDDVAMVLAGYGTNRQGRALLREYFAGPGADALERMGFAPERDARTLGELSSSPRLDLIIETNVRMAQEAGHYLGWSEDAAYYKWGIWRCGYAEKHRHEHKARDGKAYGFNHPIWTQSPPGGEFHCHCYREIASDDDLHQLGITPEPMDSPFEPSSIGYNPARMSIWTKIKSEQ